MKIKFMNKFKKKIMWKKYYNLIWILEYPNLIKIF